MENTHVHALDYLSVFNRRKWWLIAPILISIVVGLLLVKLLPKVYRSSATLGVSAPAVSPNFVNQTRPLNDQERTRELSQQLVSAPILARVASEERLAGDAGADAEIALLRRSISITVPQPVAATNQPRRLDMFVVSYTDSEPHRAQRIVSRLVTLFVEANSKARTETAESTSAFLAGELRASEARLHELEATLRRSKELFMGQLPEQTQANLQTLSGLRQQLEANATALRGEQDRLSMIERQAEGLKQGSAEALMMTRGGGSMPQTSESRVLLLERELADARGMYTDRHPEVQRLEDELTSARNDAAADRQRPSSDRVALLQLEPAYRQLMADREMARLRIRDLQRTDVDTRRQIGVYQARVESAPMVEQQLSAVQRDFDLEKTQYSELSSKLHTASIAENVERTRRGEQFTVLYPAAVPTDPIEPVPWRVMLIAVMAGICVGGGATLAREYLDRSVHNIRDLKDEFGLPVLGEVTRISAA
jgi:polysaccharide chain length determinant protein (PEP-CTERM system associated)